MEIRFLQWGSSVGGLTARNPAAVRHTRPPVAKSVALLNRYSADQSVDFIVIVLVLVIVIEMPPQYFAKLAI